MFQSVTFLGNSPDPFFFLCIPVLSSACPSIYHTISSSGVILISWPSQPASGEGVQQINHPWSQGSFSPFGQWPTALPHALDSPSCGGQGAGVLKREHMAVSPSLHVQPAALTSCSPGSPSRAPALACLADPHHFPSQPWASSSLPQSAQLCFSIPGS